MEIVAILNGPDDAGSTKYRVTQYRDFLEANGVRIEAYRKGELSRRVVKRVGQADLLLNQKCLFNGRLGRAMLRAARASIFDFDDAVWTRPGRPNSFFTRRRVRRRLHDWLAGASMVLASNDYLASYAHGRGATVRVLPMAIDMNQWRPADVRNGDTVAIGWAGSPVNLPYLRSIAPVLGEVQTRYPHVRVRVFCGEDPKLPVPHEYVPYAPGAEAEFTRGLDIGLLPLSDDEFLKGKSPIKAIQYLACGLPVVGYIAGGTGEILNEQRAVAVSTEAEWIAALSDLIENRPKRLAMGRNGRAFAVTRHDFDRTKITLLNLLRRCAAGEG